MPKPFSPETATSPPLPQEPCSQQHSFPRQGKGRRQTKPQPSLFSSRAGLKGIFLFDWHVHPSHTSPRNGFLEKCCSFFSEQLKTFGHNWDTYRGFSQNLGHANRKLRSPLQGSCLANWSLAFCLLAGDFRLT